MRGHDVGILLSNAPDWKLPVCCVAFTLKINELESADGPGCLLRYHNEINHLAAAITIQTMTKMRSAISRRIPVLSFLSLSGIVPHMTPLLCAGLQSADTS